MSNFHLRQTHVSRTPQGARRFIGSDSHIPRAHTNVGTCPSRHWHWVQQTLCDFLNAGACEDPAACVISSRPNPRVQEITQAGSSQAPTLSTMGPFASIFSSSMTISSNDGRALMLFPQHLVTWGVQIEFEV